MSYAAASTASPASTRRRYSAKPHEGACTFRNRARPTLVNAWTTPGGTTTDVPARRANRLAVDAELELALEHVEAVRVAKVHVVVCAVVLGVDEVLEHVGVVRLHLHEREPVRLRRAGRRRRAR